MNMPNNETSTKSTWVLLHFIIEEQRSPLRAMWVGKLVGISGHSSSWTTFDNSGTAHAHHASGTGHWQVFSSQVKIQHHQRSAFVLVLSCVLHSPTCSLVTINFAKKKGNLNRGTDKVAVWNLSSHPIFHKYDIGIAPFSAAWHESHTGYFARDTADKQNTHSQV